MGWTFNAEGDEERVTAVRSIAAVIHSFGTKSKTAPRGANSCFTNNLVLYGVSMN